MAKRDKGTASKELTDGQRKAVEELREMSTAEMRDAISRWLLLLMRATDSEALLKVYAEAFASINSVDLP